MPLRVALIDDHLLFRDAFRALVSHDQELEIVAESNDGREIGQVYENAKPDVVVLDIALPGADGIALAGELTSRFAGSKILVLTAHAAHDHVARAFAAGVRGYALKSEPARSILAAVKEVAKGASYLAPELPASLLSSRQHPPRSRSSGRLDALSSRERQIFDLIVQGHSNSSIANELLISVKTVETHRSNINRKLSLHSSVELLRFAALQGLVYDG